MGSVMLTSGRTCMPTLSCLVAPPCTLVLLIVCKRRSLPWLPLPSRSRLLLLLRGSTLSGSEVPFWLPSPPSNRCGSPSKNTTNAAHPLFTENAFKYYFLYYLIDLRYMLLIFVILAIANQIVETNNGLKPLIYSYTNWKLFVNIAWNVNIGM